MTVFDLLGSALSAAVIAAVTYLLAHARVFGRMGRIGTGIVAAAIILTLVERLYPNSPFRDWAFVMLRAGLLLLFLSLARAPDRRTDR